MESAAALKPPRKADKRVAQPRRDRHDATINLRMPSQTRDLIDAAAKACGKSRTEFVLESARVHANDVLLDQRIFRLDDAQFAAFEAAMDNPPQPSEKLKQLLKRKARWATD